MTPRLEVHAKYRSALNRAQQEGCRQETVKYLAHTDLFYLLTRVLHREDADNDWVFQQARMYQAAPDGYLDLWWREGYKSSIITFAGTIQGLMNDPERTYGIFSYTRPAGKKFLRQIKIELEINRALQEIASDVFWRNPKKEAPKWSEDDGLVIKRKGNPKEASIEAWGLMDGQPVGPHFSDMEWEDIVNKDTVRTEGILKKARDSVIESLALGTIGGRRRAAGTRWHYADAWQIMIDRKILIPRIWTATKDGTFTGEPWLLTPEELAKKIKEYGPYIASCHVRGTRILMADWSWRNIEDVCVGDEVVGIGIPKTSEKAFLTPTKVLAKRVRRAEANRYTLESGSSVECTPDHKWWTTRRPLNGRKEYSSLGDGGYGCIKGLARIAWETPCPDLASAAWLSGIIDGEGSVNVQFKMLDIYQSEAQNPDVVKRIRFVLNHLGVGFREHPRDSKPGHQSSIQFSILGGRKTRHAILQWHRPAKEKQIVATMFGTRIAYHSKRLDKVRVIEPLGKKKVWALQTETGNYIANGFASKNCQLFMDPKQDSLQVLREEWLQYWKADRYKGLNLYLLCDPASSKKADSDYTVFMVIGLGSDRNYYVVNWIRDRLSLTQKANILFKWHQQYRPVNVGYEKYGMQSDIEHFQDRMERDNYRFGITPLGGTMAKYDRIARLVPSYSQGRWYIPESTPYTQYDGEIVDLTRAFINDEYKAHPFEVHDDMLDCKSRILDDELNAVFPQGEEIDPLKFRTPVEQEYDPLRWGMEDK